MSTTNLYPNTLIGNLAYAINPAKYVNVREINNVIHALLHDCAVLLNTNYPTTANPIKAVVRRAEDESFSLQDFTNTQDFELLITYFPSGFDYQVNDCGISGFKITVDVYYRIEAKENNKSKLEEVLGIVDQLICKNHNNAQDWQYTYSGKTFKSKVRGSSNKLISQNLQYGQIEEFNMYYAEQTFDLSFYY